MTITHAQAVLHVKHAAMIAQINEMASLGGWTASLYQDPTWKIRVKKPHTVLCTHRAGSEDPRFLNFPTSAMARKFVIFCNQSRLDGLEFVEELAKAADSL